MDELAEMLSSEHGKVLADAGRYPARAGSDRILLRYPAVLKGEYTHGAGPGIDVYSMRQPLGIGVGITPFNFPAMIPMWMAGVAIAAGNAFILKPSERDPERAGAAGRTVPRSRPARGHFQRRPRRQGNGRRDPRPS
jgi:malonate-semialdehyde dehydrogenase (acetylating) / methylmalonate-semialdehyde dehydrogenase